MPVTSPAATIRPLGLDLDVATVHVFDEQVHAAIADVTPGGVVVADMTGLEFCDSSGVRSLVNAAQAARRANCRFEARNVPAHIARVLAIAGVLGMITVAAEA